MKDLFKGYKVVELSSVLAGPYAGMMFSECGAEVIKIENLKTGGDVTRTWKIRGEDSSTPISAYYSSINYHKEILHLDLTKLGHINKVYQHLKDADVVITNFKKGDDYKFALDYGRVKVINPNIIYAHVSGFESFEERLAFDVVLQAECGFMSMNGQKDSPPTKMPVALIDVLAGLQLRTAILAALLQREKTKKGSNVSVSLERSALASLVNQASNYLMLEKIPERIGSKHPNIALYGEIFTTLSDKQLVLAIASDKQFKKLCVAMGQSELANDQRYSSNQNRRLNISSLTEVISEIIKSKPLEFWQNEFESHNIPFGEVKKMDAVCQGSLAQSMVLEEEIEGVPTQRLSTLGFKFD